MQRRLLLASAGRLEFRRLEGQDSARELKLLGDRLPGHQRVNAPGEVSVDHAGPDGGGGAHPPDTGGAGASGVWRRIASSMHRTTSAVHPV